MYDTLVLIVLVLIVLFLIDYHDNLQGYSRWNIWKNNRINKLWDLAQKSLIENNLLEAERSLLTILQIDPLNASAYNRIGILYAKQQEYLDAAECFQAAYSIQQNVSSIHNLGLVYFNLEKYQQASIALKQALELDSQSAIRYVEYAKALERLGQFKEMVEVLEEAVRLEPKTEIIKILIKTYNIHNMPKKAKKMEEKLNKMIKPISQTDHLRRSNRTIF